MRAATIQCSHSFCWACIDRWLQTKQFVCPVCRTEALRELETCAFHGLEVTREPVRTRAVDMVVQKTVSQCSEEDKAFKKGVKREAFAAEAEFASRLEAAEACGSVLLMMKHAKMMRG